MMQKKMKNTVSCHQIKDVFQEEWDQIPGNKVKMRVKNWSQASHCQFMWNCGVK